MIRLTLLLATLMLSAPSAHANAYDFWNELFWRADGNVYKPADKPNPRLEATASRIKSLPVSIGTERQGYIALNLRQVRDTGATVTYIHNGKEFDGATVAKGGNGVVNLRSVPVDLKPGDTLRVKIATPGKPNFISWAVECVYTVKDGDASMAASENAAKADRKGQKGKRSEQNRSAKSGKSGKGGGNGKGGRR
jgi:hypothetical protein